MAVRRIKVSGSAGACIEEKKHRGVRCPVRKDGIALPIPTNTFSTPLIFPEEIDDPMIHMFNEIRRDQVCLILKLVSIPA